METNLIVYAYAIYLPVTLALTYFVARMLFKNGRVFMMDIFNGREEIANATNQLFQVGFYLLNIGFALVFLEIYGYLNNVQTLVEKLGFKIGYFAIYLGIMLFFNLYLFFRGKRKAKQNKQMDKLINTPPAPPNF